MQDRSVQMNMPYIFLQDAYFHFPDTQSCVCGIQASKAKHWEHIDSVFYCAVLGHDGVILFLFGSFLFQFTFLSSYLGNENPII